MAEKRLYSFGNFVLDPMRHVLLRDTQPVAVAPKALDILVALVERAGQVVEKNELLATVWPDTVVEENNLTVHIAALRKALGEKAEGRRYIVTLPGRGYRMAEPVALWSDAPKVDASDIAVPRQDNGTLAVPVKDVAVRPWSVRPRYPILVAFTGVLVWGVFKYMPGPSPTVVEQQVTTNSSEAPVAAAVISPDGKYVAYADPAGLKVRVLQSGDIQTLSMPESLTTTALSWFPDGARLLVTVMSSGTDRMGVWSVPLAGGGARELRPDARQAVVSPDSERIAYLNPAKTEVWVMRTDGSAARQVYRTATDSTVEGLQFIGNGRRLGFARAQSKFDSGSQTDEVNVEALDVDTGAVTVLFSNTQLIAAVLMADGRIIYSTKRSLRAQERQLWQIRVDARGERVINPPKRIAVWRDFASVSDFSASADGSRLAFLKKSAPQADVLVADLSADGRDIQRTRRLTLDDRDDYPTGWTHDSAAVLFCSDRNGNFDIFKQTLDRHSPEPIVATSKDERGPAAITPDGAWYIYFRIPDNPTGKLEPNTWMRVPTGGGASHPVLEKPVFGEISCARAPSDLCVLSDVDRSEIRFYALHPVKGRGRELARVDSGPDLWTRWSISPDGKRIAIARNDRIQVITLDAHSVSGNSTVDLFTPGWKDLSGLAWSADSRGFYISVGSTHAMTLLSVSLGGAVRKMWESTGQAARLVTASPDGRRLAFTKWNAAQNVWLIANF